MRKFIGYLLGCTLFCGVLAGSAVAQSLVLAAIQTDAGSVKKSGATFSYRLTYTCNSASGPCLNAEVVQLLPAELQFATTVPASPTADVAAINVTANFMGSGRTRVQFVMVTPLSAGQSGDMLINVRFPNGSTPDGTVAVATADGINLGNTPGTLTTPPVSVTAVASLQASLQKSLLTSPANLDFPESYRLRVSVSAADGSLNLTNVGPWSDTLPPGTVFNGANPAADCEPGCTGTTPATLTWTSPCTLPLAPGGNCDVQVNATFPSATFPSGANVTNLFTADGQAVGQSSQSLGSGSVTHSVSTFVPAANASLNTSLATGTPNPPTFNQPYSYALAISNSGNVPLDNVLVTDALPVEFHLSSVTTGAYSGGVADYGVGVGVQASYEKNTALGVFTLWGSSPSAATSTTLLAPPPGLGAGEYVTRVRLSYGQWQAGATATTPPRITGTIAAPDNAGGPVAIGDSVQNCADVSAVYFAGPSNITQSSCAPFAVSGPFVQLDPAIDVLSGAGPFTLNQNVALRIRVRSAPQSSDPSPLANVVAAILLPAGLSYTSSNFDDQGTGLPAPQTLTPISNFAGTGQTLLRWSWNTGSGNLGANQQLWINLTTTVNGSAGGDSVSELALASNAPGLAQRCSAGSAVDSQDRDGDGAMVDTICVSTASVAINFAPQFINASPPATTLNDAYNYTLTASGFPTPTFSVASGNLPPGITLDPASGVLSGNSTSAGTFGAVLQATNLVNPPAVQAISIVVARLTQTISSLVANPANPVYGPAATIALSAVASSGLPVTFTIAPASVAACSVNGNTITILASGNCTVLADQAGDASYDAAAQLPLTVVIAKAEQTLSFAAQSPSTQIYAPGASFTINPLATGGASGNPVTYSAVIASGTVCSVSGTTVTILSVGICTIAADQAGNGNYLAAVQVSQAVTIAAATQTIVGFAATPAVPLFSPNATFTVSATGGASGNPLIYSISVSSNAVCSISGATVTILTAGNCTVLADQAGNANYSAAAQASLVVPIGVSSSSVNLTSDHNPAAYGQPVTFTVTISGASLTQGSDVASSAKAATSVAAITGTVTFMDATTTLGTVALAAGTVGTANFTANFLASGTHTITANYSGDGNYGPVSGALVQVISEALPVPTLGPTALLLLTLLLAALLAVVYRARRAL